MIAIDMPMPNNCCDCPGNDHDAWCGITLTEFGDDFCKIRLPDCPLIELPEVSCSEIPNNYSNYKSR